MSFTSRTTPLSTDVRQVRTRNALAKALLDSLSVMPFDEITIRQLTSAAGIAYATFFRHYASKEALLEFAAAQEIRELVELVTPLFELTNPQASCNALCEGIERKWGVWRVLLTGAAKEPIREELLRIAREMVPRSRPSWPPAELRTAIPVAVIFEVFEWWLVQPKPPPATTIGQLIFQRAIAPGLLGQL